MPFHLSGREADDHRNYNNNSPSGAVLSTAIIKYNYKSQQHDELSLVKGSKIKVLEKSDDGWWKGDLDGSVGWFPSNYVVEQAASESKDVRHSNNANSITGSSNQNTSLLKASTDYNKQSGFFSDNQISANKTGLQSIDTSFAPSFKTHRQQSSTAHHDHRNPGEAEEEVLFVVVALYSFQARSNEELSFTKDERLDIIEKPANDPDWWRARNKSHEIGLVPKNYVQIVPGVKAVKADMDLSSAMPTNDLFADKFGSESYNQPSNQQCQTTSATLASSAVHDNGSGVTQSSSTVDALFQSAHELAVKLNLNEKVWYHGVMSRQQCDQLLNAYADDGDFLVRNSETSAGEFSVSLKAPMRNKHFRVHYMNDGFCIGQRTFASLDELVEHYKRTPIYTSATGDKMFLKKPYCR